jgi:hypothetical protein
VKHQVVNLVVTMHKCTPVFWLRLWVAKERYHVVEVGYFPYWYACALVLGLGLSGLDCIERVELAVVEA